jgi:phytoene dehydrogenase-like protein
MPHALTSRDSTMESKPVGSYEPTGIDVLIVGTGLAGLVAALECTRKGHNVRVLERNSDINTAGNIASTREMRASLTVSR